MSGYHRLPCYHWLSWYHRPAAHPWGPRRGSGFWAWLSGRGLLADPGGFAGRGSVTELNSFAGGGHWGWRGVAGGQLFSEHRRSHGGRSRFQGCGLGLQRHNGKGRYALTKPKPAKPALPKPNPPERSRPAPPLLAAPQAWLQPPKPCPWNQQDLAAGPRRPWPGIRQNLATWQNRLSFRTFVLSRRGGCSRVCVSRTSP